MSGIQVHIVSTSAFPSVGRSVGRSFIIAIYSIFLCSTVFICCLLRLVSRMETGRQPKPCNGCADACSIWACEITSFNQVLSMLQLIAIWSLLFFVMFRVYSLALNAMWTQFRVEHKNGDTEIAGKLRRRIFVVIDFKSKWVKMKLRNVFFFFFFSNTEMHANAFVLACNMGSSQHHRVIRMKCEMNEEKWKNECKKLEWIAFHYLIVRSFFFPPLDFCTQMNAVFTPLCTVRVSRHPIIILFLTITVFRYIRRARNVHAAYVPISNWLY